MEFSSDDHSNIRRWLGYQATAQTMQTIRDRCTTAAAADPNVVKQVRDILRELERMSQELKSGRRFMDRTLTSNTGGTTQRSPGFGRQYYREELHRNIDELAQTLQLTVNRYPDSDVGGFKSSGKIIRA